MKDEEKKAPPAWEAKDSPIPTVNGAVPGDRGESHKRS